MERLTERLVFVTLIASLGGVIAGLVLAQTLSQSRAEAPHAFAPIVFDCNCQQPVPPPDPVVTDCAVPNIGVPSLAVPRRVVAAGELIHFSVGKGQLGTNAWVGLIPSSIPHGDDDRNDAHDVDYRYVVADASYSLLAPEHPGSYDLRLHSRYPDGAEVATLSILVVPAGSGAANAATQ